MTISPLMIYLIDVCHSLCVIANVVLAVALVGTAILMAERMDSWHFDDYKESAKSGVLKYAFITILVSALGCIFIPSKTVLVQMLVIPPIVNNEQIQELPSNVLNFVNDFLKEVGKKEKNL